MPSNKATPASNASKRVRTESTRKREAREHAEAAKHECVGKKAAAKARKDFRDEAAETDLLVEREVESAQLAKLRARALQLESENQRMKAKLARREEQEGTPTIKIIPAPDNKGDVDVELLRHHLGLVGEEHDVQWSLIRQDFRGLLIAGGLNWQRPWSKQEVDRVNTLFHAAENRRPEMKRFANHWGTEFLLKECFGNLYFYHHRLANKYPSSSTGRSTTHNPTDSPSDSRDTDIQQDRARKAAAHKAAAYRAAERKAAKRKADTQDDGRNNLQDEAGIPYNDGETEIEQLSDERRKEIERDEIGVPGLSIKPMVKANASPLKTPNTQASSSSTSNRRKDTPNPASGSKPRPDALKRSHGGKVGSGGNRARGGTPVADLPEDTSSAHDEDVLSVSSGQTTSESEDD